jgi:hypothetical protein
VAQATSAGLPRADPRSVGPIRPDSCHRGVSIKSSSAKSWRRSAAAGGHNAPQRRAYQPAICSSRRPDCGIGTDSGPNQPRDAASEVRMASCAVPSDHLAGATQSRGRSRRRRCVVSALAGCVNQPARKPLTSTNMSPDPKLSPSGTSQVRATAATAAGHAARQIGSRSTTVAAMPLPPLGPVEMAQGVPSQGRCIGSSGSNALGVRISVGDGLCDRVGHVFRGRHPKRGARLVR